MDGATPADQIALLVGVPTNFDEFVERVPSSDFLSKYKPESDIGDPREALKADWDERYGPLVGSPIHELLDLSTHLRLRVFPRATLNSLREASEACRVLIVFAHWKGSEILYEDLSPHCTREAIAERARHFEGPLASWLLDHLADASNRLGWTFLSRQDPPLVKVLQEAVNLAWEAEPEDSVVDRRSALSITLAARRRDELDDMLGDLIRPGNRIEWFDGLHSKGAFEAALSPGFRGFLDLTTCTSTILADHVSQVRSATMRLLQFPKQQELLWHAQCVSAALEWTIQRGLSYPQARLEAEAALKQVLAEMAAARVPDTNNGRTT